MTRRRAFVVYNPASSAGRTKARWQQLAPLVAEHLGEVEVHETEGPGDATFAVREALRDGPRAVLCIGGDGTNHEVVNGFFEADATTPVAPEATFSFLVSGTGGDLSRTFPATQDPAALLPRIAAGDARPLDLIGCTYAGDDGSEQRELIVNIASLGLGGWVCRTVDGRSKSALPAKALFFATSVEALFRTRPYPVRVQVDDGPEEALDVRNLVLANGRYQGGGMHIAPDAKTDDGQMDVVVSGAFRALPMVAASRLIYAGRGHEHPLISMRCAREVRVAPAPGGPDVFLEMDGEAVGRAPAHFTLIPGAIRAIV